MLAFLDSPVQLIIAAVVILIVFGPQKLPEIAGQIGRALRELKRTTSDLQDSFNLDSNRYEEHYNPPSYDTYGNPTSSTDTNTASIPESDLHHSSLPATNTHAAIAASEPVYGDFASSALSDAGSEYGYAPIASNAAHGGASSYTAGANTTAAGTVAATREVELRPAEGSVPR